nr:MAG TPA: hypothetical protein [Caudoviricetes sp.]
MYIYTIFIVHNYHNWLFSSIIINVYLIYNYTIIAALPIIKLITI